MGYVNIRYANGTERHLGDGCEESEPLSPAERAKRIARDPDAKRWHASWNDPEVRDIDHPDGEDRCDGEHHA